jgi:hypothetical protein
MSVDENGMLDTTDFREGADGYSYDCSLLEELVFWADSYDNDVPWQDGDLERIACLGLCI